MTHRPLLEGIGVQRLLVSLLDWGHLLLRLREVLVLFLHSLHYFQGVELALRSAALRAELLRVGACIERLQVVDCADGAGSLSWTRGDWGKPLLHCIFLVELVLS